MHKRRFIIGSIGIVVIAAILVAIFIMQDALASTLGLRKQQPSSIQSGSISCTTQPGSKQCSSPISVDVAGRDKGKGTGHTPASTATKTPKPTATSQPQATPTGAVPPIHVVPTPQPTAAAPQPTQAPPTGGGGGSLPQQLFNQINADRSAAGLPAYGWNDTLASTAYQHSVKMGQGCGLSHQCSGEPAPCDRVSNAGLSWTACGENAGYTSPYPDAWSAVKKNIEGGMLAEQPPNDGHRRNLLSSSFHKVGIGIFTDSQGVVWVTEDFTN